ncbi:hypothetical protein L1987_04054 [Smallanthus sonchifolius]|uniref:Uncharacterized protein n=1 Tax=Smallanthus sonchifolius TaxID=185202 RepID=A0ACB9KCC0_9ASTR|nr:hypothetical protein L1987_04054 [Smallanthus sonchifolius]
MSLGTTLVRYHKLFSLWFPIFLFQTLIFLIQQSSPPSNLLLFIDYLQGLFEAFGSTVTTKAFIDFLQCFFEAASSHYCHNQGFFGISSTLSCDRNVQKRVLCFQNEVELLYDIEKEIGKQLEEFECKENEVFNARRVNNMNLVMAISISLSPRYLLIDSDLQVLHTSGSSSLIHSLRNFLHKGMFGWNVTRVSFCTEDSTTLQTVGSFNWRLCMSLGRMGHEEGRLVKSGSFMHSYLFCRRSDTPLIYRVVPSWMGHEEGRLVKSGSFMHSYLFCKRLQNKSPNARHKLDRKQQA